MRLNPFPVIWRSEPVRLELPADGTIALARVRQRVPGLSFRSSLEGGCKGRVTDRRARLQYHRPPQLASLLDFPPVLDVRRTPENGVNSLTGVYRTSWPARVQLSLGFAVVLVSIPTLFPWGAYSFSSGDLIGAVSGMIKPTAIYLMACGAIDVGQRSWEGHKADLRRFLTDSWPPSDRE